MSKNENTKNIPLDFTTSASFSNEVLSGIDWTCFHGVTMTKCSALTLENDMRCADSDVDQLSAKMNLAIFTALNILIPPAFRNKDIRWTVAVNAPASTITISGATSPRSTHFITENDLKIIVAYVHYMGYSRSKARMIDVCDMNVCAVDELSIGGDMPTLIRADMDTLGWDIETVTTNGDRILRVSHEMSKHADYIIVPKDMWEDDRPIGNAREIYESLIVDRQSSFIGISVGDTKSTVRVFDGENRCNFPTESIVQGGIAFLQSMLISLSHVTHGVNVALWRDKIISELEKHTTSRMWFVLDPNVNPGTLTTYSSGTTRHGQNISENLPIYRINL